ncbi:MAG: tRNA 4-thiouridine(8) synthase ThiI [Thermotogae bacterium]|nr:tRNA 4-thiouridine(8) synthase ThiI [Thermotogota bacterium]
MFLIRYSSEIFTKSEGVKRQFIHRLADNVREALARFGHSGKVRRDRDRIYVETEEDISHVLRRIFGVAAYARAVEWPFEGVDRLKERLSEVFAHAVRGKKFAVRVKVRDRTYSSQQLERDLGAVLYPHSAGVNLESPEVQINVEIRGERVFVHHRWERGPGGLPVGTQARALALVSGGFDSPVAAWMSLKRGVKLDFVLYDLGGEEHIRGTHAILRRLYEDWIFGYTPRFYVVDFSPILEALFSVKRELRLVVLKRMMYRAGEIMSRSVRAEALITGESIGQVSTQTLPNLRVIEEAVRIPVIRPLATYDKEEIIAKARDLAIYDLSASIPEFCAIATSSPVRTRLREVKVEEEKVLPALTRAMENVRLLSLDSDYDEADPLRAPEGLEGKVVYVSPERFGEVLKESEGWPKDGTYILVCRKGRLSRQLAKILRDRGYDAYYRSLS